MRATASAKSSSPHRLHVLVVGEQVTRRAFPHGPGARGRERRGAVGSGQATVKRAHQIAAFSRRDGRDVILPAIRVHRGGAFLVEPVELGLAQQEDPAQHELGDAGGMRLRIGEGERASPRSRRRPASARRRRIRAAARCRRRGPRSCCARGSRAAGCVRSRAGRTGRSGSARDRRSAVPACRNPRPVRRAGTRRACRSDCRIPPSRSRGRCRRQDVRAGAVRSADRVRDAGSCTIHPNHPRHRTRFALDSAPGVRRCQPESRSSSWARSSSLPMPFFRRSRWSLLRRVACSSAFALWVGLLPPLFAYFGTLKFGWRLGVEPVFLPQSTVLAICARVFRGAAAGVPEQRSDRALDGRDL